MAHDKCLKEASKKCDCIADTIDDLTKKNEELRAENGKLKDIEVAKCLCDIGENETGILMSEQVYKALQAENRKLKEQQLTEDELLFIITPKGLPPLPKHIRLAKKIIEARKGVIWTQR